MARKSIKWDVTKKCNLHCAHCSVGKEYFVAGVSEISAPSKLEVVDKLAEGGVGGLSLLGGEPLTLGEDLLAIIKRGTEKGIKMSLVTNGLLLEGEFMKRLVASGLYRIVISMEGASKETHEAIRGKGTFERLLNNISCLKQHVIETDSPLFIGVNTVFSRKNLNEVEVMFDLLEKLGVNEWTLLSLGDVGFAKDNIDELSITAQDEIDLARRVAEKVHKEKDSTLSINPLFTYPLVWDYIEKQYGLKMNKPRICCTASISLGFVSPDGNLFQCDRVSKEYYVGYKIDGVEIKPMSLLDQSFYDIWNSEQYVKLFNFILKDSTYQNYKPCNRCVHFKTRYCTPCPLYSLNSNVVIASCSIVAKEMGASFEQLGSSSQVDELFGFEKASLDTRSDYVVDDRIGVTVPKKKNGVRSFRNGEYLLLLNPVNIDYVSLNLVGRAIWELIDGEKTVEEICREIIESVDIAGGKVLPDDRREIHERLKQQVISFLETLRRIDLVSL